MNEMWKITDPRYSINKRDNIIIIRPHSDGKNKIEAGTGYVDTKEAWCIWTSFENHKFFNADDKWEDDWLWTYAPEIK